MSITVTGVSASPTSIGSGAQSVVTPALSDPDHTSTITISADGSSKTVAVTIHETETFSVNPADVGITGKVVATVDQGGTLAVGPSGTFVFTAS